MEYSDTAKNRWEEMLFGFFKEGLTIRTDFDQIILNAGIGITFGWIIPTESTINFLYDTIKTWGLPSTTNAYREFEREVSARVADIIDHYERLRLLHTLRLKFEDVTASRLPKYSILISLLQDRVSMFTNSAMSDQQRDEDFELLTRVGIMTQYIGGVKDVIDRAYDYHSRAINDVNRVINQAKTIEEKGDDNTHTIEINQKSQKLKFLCSPSVAGYIIQQLIVNEFIEAPLHGSEWSFKRTAKICWDLFDFGSTTIGNLEKEISVNTCSLSDLKRAKFQFPRKSDLA